MGNVLRVLARDAKRLITTPATWAVVLFLSVLPSLYTWFNVAGFWNPYDNTGSLSVCVVNEDAGADVEALGQLDLGDQIVDQLSGNTQLGWEFVDRQAAEDLVQSGEAYAAFVIPEEFSEDVASIISGDFKQPEIVYLVNEKVGPVAPKITDTGANTLDATINEAFVSAVSETVAKAVDERLDELDQAGEGAKSSAVAKVREAREGIAAARGELGGFAEKTDSAKGAAVNAKSQVADAKAHLDGLSDTLAQVSSLAATANTSLLKFTTAAGTTLDKGSAEVSQSAAHANAAVAKDANAILSAKGNVDGAIARGSAITQENDRIIEQLEALGKGLPDNSATKEIEEALASLKGVNDTVKRDLSSMRQLSDDIAASAASVRDATGAANTAVQQTLASTDSFRATLSDSVIPAISDDIARIATIAADLSSQAAAQKAIIDEALLALDELSSTLATAASSLSATSDKLGDLEAQLATLETDFDALGSAGALSELIGSDRIDPARIADFMRSPTQVVTEQLYPLNAYGSAMAPLFINLTLWIGVFMLMVIMRLEVDDEGIEHLTITQRFFARLLLLAPIVCIQSAICCTGCIALGVQSANVAAFYLTAAIASLSYLAIQYSLSTTLQHVGKAMCIILVFVQIPGASGLYPIEMTPDFFRHVYPLFPFTYGINAMRETISGFYGDQWISCIGVLLLFMAIFLAIGSIVRPYLTNLNRMFAREISESDLVIGENVELPARRWRMSQVIRALSDRDEYRELLEQRAKRFMSLYPRFKDLSLGLGVLIPVLIGVILIPLGVDKVIVLTAWLAWLVLIVVFLLAVEFLRDSLSHELSLETMDASEVRTLISGRNRLTHVKPLAQDVVADSASSQEEEGSR